MKHSIIDVIKSSQVKCGEDRLSKESPLKVEALGRAGETFGCLEREVGGGFLERQETVGGLCIGKRRRTF